MCTNSLTYNWLDGVCKLFEYGQCSDTASNWKRADCHGVIFLALWSYSLPMHMLQDIGITSCLIPNQPSARTQRNSCFLLYSYQSSSWLLRHLRTKQKLFYRVQVKSGAMFGNSSCSDNSYFTLSTSHGPLHSLIAVRLYAYRAHVWINCTMPCRAGTCWWAYKVANVLLQLQAQPGCTLAWRVQLAASSDLPWSMMD